MNNLVFYFTKLMEYNELVNSNKIQDAKNLINFETDKKFYFAYIQKAGYIENYSLLEFLLEKIPVNIKSSKSETVLYYLCFNNSSRIIKYFIKKGAYYSISDTIYHPLIASIKNTEVFSYLLRLPNIDLNVIDENLNTVVIILAKNNDLNKIKYFCGIYFQKYGKERLIEFLNQKNNTFQTALDIAGLYDNLDIVRYLSTHLLLPEKTIIQGKVSLYTVYKFKDTVFIINKPYSFNTFYTKCNLIMNHYNWLSMNNLKDIKFLYNLKYPNKDIILALHICQIKDLSHDLESIIYICKKLKEDRNVQIIQKLWRSKKNQYIDDPIRKATITLQRCYRRKKYIKTLKNNNCSICFDLLDDSKCILLIDCNHLFHTNCINRWRKEKGHCPICRKSISNSPVGI